MRDEVRVIRSPEIVSISLEPTRTEILRILSERDMTVVKLAVRLNKHPTTIYRHIKKLEENHFVKVSGVKWKSHSSEYVYGRTARLFVPGCGYLNGNGRNDLKLTWSENQTRRIIDYLKMLGYNDNSEDIEKKIHKLFSELDDMCLEKIEEIKDHDDVTYLDCLALKKILLLHTLVHYKDVRERVESVFLNIEDSNR
ncbi:MAG: winged helix-turn-helix domain-containing protein [Thermoplasmata archaeon]